ncbi:MAG: 50S ribosomal protein L29 [Myxococcales bacterium]|nr:50S ribosomal protein L29 [Myxococcales bacterium]
MSDEQLVHRELELERELIATTFRHKTGQLDDTTRLGRIRKDIARVRTAERAREREHGMQSNALRDRYRGSFRPGQSTEATPAQAASGGFLKGLVDKIKGTE